MKSLILYYSYGGNTRRVAKMIQEVIGGDVAEIETVKPYTGDYNTVAKKGKLEIDSGFMPEIQALQVRLADYDTIVLGSPVWWYTFAPAIKTFFTTSDLKGKEVLLVCFVFQILLWRFNNEKHHFQKWQPKNGGQLRTYAL